MNSAPLTESETALALELVTPLHVGSGEPEGGSDGGVVRDFNGLPGIPGTSIQGMLRAAVAEAKDEDAAKRIFGHSSIANRGTGRGGRLSVSWGVIHDQNNQPVRQHLTAAEREKDPVLRDAARPMLRDHVRLTERGVAETKKRGKFDELVVSAGHRFTVKLRFVTAVPDQATAARKEETTEPDHKEDWQLLEGVLRASGLRLGGKTRRGLGAFKVGFPQTGNAPAGTQRSVVEATALPGPSGSNEAFSLELVPESLWMFGGGASELADSAPVSGTLIKWDTANHGSVRSVWIIPGSAVKGALRHRALFHANRLAGNFIDRQTVEAEKRAHGWVDELFGPLHGGAAGKVFIDDIFIPQNTVQRAPVQNHVAINPLTGGAKDSALFNDEPLQPAAVPVRLMVHLRGAVSPKAREALAAALGDLAAGRLPLGAHAGRGYGVFKQKDAALQPVVANATPALCSP